MKIRLKVESRSHRYDTDRSSHRHRQIYANNKMSRDSLGICIKQHLSNIWNSIHEKVKQHWDWVEKSISYKKACNLLVLVPLKLFQVCFSFIYRIIKQILLIRYIWLSPTIHVFLLSFIVLEYDWLPERFLIKVLLCVLISFAVITLEGRMSCEFFFHSWFRLSICDFTALMVTGWCMIL